MNARIYWGITILVMIVITGVLGRRVKYRKADGTEGDGHVLGIFVDNRQRFSLTHFQSTLWVFLLISLLVAIFLDRLVNSGDPSTALNISIPQEILVLAGISGGSAVIATAIKSSKDLDATQPKPMPTRFAQMFMVEDGEQTDKVIDVTKFQNFFFTLIAAGAYLVLALASLPATGVAAGFPPFGRDLLWLMGVSHAAYVGAKVPDKL